MGTRWEISVAARPVRVRRVEAFCATPDRKAPVLPPCANVTTYEFGRNYLISLVGLDRRSARPSIAPVACRTSCNGGITHPERSSGNSGCQFVGDAEGDNQRLGAPVSQSAEIAKMAPFVKTASYVDAHNNQAGGCCAFCCAPDESFGESAQCAGQSERTIRKSMSLDPDIHFRITISEPRKSRQTPYLQRS